MIVAVGTPVAQRPPHRSVRAELLHTAPTLDEWRRSAHSDADAGSLHSGSTDRPTARTVPRSSCLADSAAEAHGTIARLPEPESCSDYPYCRAPHGSCSSLERLTSTTSRPQPLARASGVAALPSAP